MKNTEQKNREVKKQHLNLFQHFQTPPEEFAKMAVHLLLKEKVIYSTDDEHAIKRVQDIFISACENHLDEAGVYLLKLIEKLYEVKKKNIAEGSDGNRNLGQASDQAKDELRTWLIKIYWELPDKRVVPDRCSDTSHPTLSETKSWIFQQIIEAWVRPDGNYGTNAKPRSSNEKSLVALDFLSTAHTPPDRITTIPKKERKSPFRDKAKKRMSWETEQKEIIKLVESRNDFFDVEELEGYIKKLILPPEIEKKLAFARIRKRPDRWREDIFNAELTKLFKSSNRSSEAIEIFKKVGGKIAEMDKKKDFSLLKNLGI